MKTLGVDLAAQAVKTAVCLIEWSDGSANASTPIIGVTDREICDLAERCDVIGIDAPFGWPVPFVELMHERDSVGDAAVWTAERRDSLRFRLTDHRVREVLGRWPLSVSSDLIAIAAMRCDGLLRLLGVADRSGDGRVFEVYPAVALSAWSFASRGYKPRGTRSAGDGAGLHNLVQAFLHACPWLIVSPDAQAICARSDDAFDALIASLVARAAGIGLATRPTNEEAIRATKEGWIAVPHEDSLGRLAIP